MPTDSTDTEAFALLFNRGRSCQFLWGVQHAIEFLAADGGFGGAQFFAVVGQLFAARRTFGGEFAGTFQHCLQALNPSQMLKRVNMLAQVMPDVDGCR